MADKIKILFLAANPVDVSRHSRLGKEFREIYEKIRIGANRDSFELISELAVRPSDLQKVLQIHCPHIVHFSGRGHAAEGILLEDDFGKAKLVDKRAFANLFGILKENILIVVLNACYARNQAKLISRTIDFTIGMNSEIGDEAAIVFAAQFYQSLSFGRSVKEAFDLAVNAIKLEGINGAKVPELLVRRGVNDAKPSAFKSFGPKEVEPEIGVALDVQLKRRYGLITSLYWVFAIISVSLALDILQRFLSNEGNWLGRAITIAQPILIGFAAIATILAVASVVLPYNAIIKRAVSSSSFGRPSGRWKVTVVTVIALLLVTGLWLYLPKFAHYYNEKGFRLYSADPPDLSGARESYKQALRLAPDYSAALYNLALVYEDLHDDNAIEQYLLAIKYDSHIYPAYNNLARLYLLRGRDNDYQNALNILTQAVELSPDDSDVQYALQKNLGWANYLLKNYQQAEQNLSRAILLREDKAAAHCLLAYVLKAQRKAGADDESFECVSLAPGEKGIEAKWVSDAQECLMKGR